MTLKSDIADALDKIITPELAALADAAVAYAASRQGGTTTPITPPAAMTYYTVHGIECKLFSVENPIVRAGDKVWFHFTVNNTLAEPVGFEILAPKTETQCAQSYTCYTLQPGEMIENWRDHIEFSAAGVYQLYLAISFEDANLAKQMSPKSPWFKLSSPITITVGE